MLAIFVGGSLESYGTGDHRPARTPSAPTDHMERSFTLAIACGFAGVLGAQQIDLSLHPTAVPDSFEVRATATSGEFVQLPSAVFTLRWELASGGVANNADVHRPCGALAFFNYGGTVDVGAFRYFTLVLDGDRPLGQAGCPITSAGTTLCGVRIRQLTGCRNVALVENAYTGMNNLDYFISVGGLNVTGAITSQPIPGGSCPPCAAPTIQGISAGLIPSCGAGPLDLAVQVSGTAADLEWRNPAGQVVHYAPTCHLPQALPGWYGVRVFNACGEARDSVLVTVDPAWCEPPEIDSVWFEILPPWGTSMHMFAAATGSCLEYSWRAGNAWPQTTTVPSSNYLQVVVGPYTVIAQGPCGADTMVVELTPEMACLPPVLGPIYSTGAEFPCNQAPFSLYCGTTGGLPVTQRTWIAPNGDAVGNMPSLWLAPPQAGFYQFVASNACGADTAYYLVDLDTTGAATCTPPVINDFTFEPVCTGDTLWLEVDFTADGPCLDLIWWGTGSDVVEVAPGWAYVPNANSGSYGLFIANACGLAQVQAPADVVASRLDMELSLCVGEDPIALGPRFPSAIVEGGHWEGPAGWSSGVFHPEQDVDGRYTYYHPGGCVALQLDIVAYPAVYAGLDTTFTLCRSDGPVELFPYLGPGVAEGGTWRTGPLIVFNGVIDPANISSSGVFNCRYHVVGIGGMCYDVAYLTVLAEDPLLWYADVDADGLGDPLDTLLSCDTVPGFVAVAGDACPQVVGTVGDPCDDGFPHTVNDVLTAACVCEGASSIGMAEVSGAERVLWPNPSAGTGFFLQLPEGQAMVHITVMDATGRVLHRLTRSAPPAPWEVRLPQALAAGTYFIGVAGEAGAVVLRWVVE